MEHRRGVINGYLNVTGQEEAFGKNICLKWV